MEPFTFLLVMSTAMFFGSFLAGSLPLLTTLSEKKIRLFNCLGAGLFIGTSLMVVIPEGVETVYTSTASGLNFTESLLSVVSNVTIADLPLAEMPFKQSPVEPVRHHTAIGLVLLIGFGLMFIIDQLSSLHPDHPAIEYTELNRVGSLTRFEPETRPTPSITPTIGLVVHAAADGIALGASVTDPELSMVIFLAVMVHKAPASFGLSSVLLASGLSRTSVQKQLVVFGLSAPLGAVVTYSVLRLFSSGMTFRLQYWTGLLLLFSGGTFLYVAMHALQEAAQSMHAKENKSFVWVILIGMVIPIVLNAIGSD